MGSTTAIAVAAYMGIIVLTAFVMVVVGYNFASYWWQKEYDRLLKTSVSELQKAYLGRGDLGSATAAVKNSKPKSKFKLIKTDDK